MKRHETPRPVFLDELASQLPLTLSLAEAAAILKRSKRSVQRMIHDGELHAVKTDASRAARVFIPRSELIRWMTSRAC